MDSTTKRPNWWLVLAFRPVAWRLFADLGRAASIGIDSTYFRSRRFHVGSPCPSSAVFGPAPLEKQTEGRYTEGKHSVLYLARTSELAALESPFDPDRPEIYVQEFEIVSRAWRVVRLDENLEGRAPTIQYLLLESEYLPEECEFVADPYRATQFLAFLCRLRGIQAVEYPSVRGGYEENPEAVNVAVLGPAADAAGRMVKGDPFQGSEGKETAPCGLADGPAGTREPPRDPGREVHPPSDPQSPLQQCNDHWHLAARLPEVAHSGPGGHGLERDVALPLGIPRPGEEVVQQLRHVSNRTRFFQRQCHLRYPGTVLSATGPHRCVRRSRPVAGAALRRLHGSFPGNGGSPHASHLTSPSCQVHLELIPMLTEIALNPQAWCIRRKDAAELAAGGIEARIRDRMKVFREKEHGQRRCA